MGDSRPSRPWVVYVISALIGAAAIAWAIGLPRWVCVSGSDNQTCADRIYVKWTIALACVAVALVAVGIIVVVRRVRRNRGTP